MAECLLIALSLGAVQAASAVAVFRFVAKPLSRALWARVLAAFVGALAAAVLARPLVHAVILLAGHDHDAGDVVSALTFYLFLPMTVGISGWLFAEASAGAHRGPGTP